MLCLWIKILKVSALFVIAACCICIFLYSTKGGLRVEASPLVWYSWREYNGIYFEEDEHSDQLLKPFFQFLV